MITLWVKSFYPTTIYKLLIVFLSQKEEYNLNLLNTKVESNKKSFQNMVNHKKTREIKENKRKKP